MPFVVSTSRPPTAVRGAVAGQFLGDGEQLVLLNRVNVVSLFRGNNHSFEHLADFNLFASLKFIESLPLFDGRGCGRHVAFFLSAKQEVSVVAFERRTDGQIGMVTLFHGDVETYFHQGNINDTSLCCSGLCRSPTGGLLPVVLFSIFRGDVIGFDAVAAIFTYSRSTKNTAVALSSLFPPEYVQNVIMKAKRCSVFLHGGFAAAEIDVRSIALGCRDGSSGTLSLLVLYAERTGKTHVSEYVVNFWKNEEQRHPSRATGRTMIPEALALLPASDMMERKGVLLTNVEANACLLHAAHGGFYVVGPQLLTFSPWRSVGTQSGAPRNVTTLEVPYRGGYVEPKCCATLPDHDLLICFEDGSHIKVETRIDGEGLQSARGTLTQSSGVQLRTVPTCVAVVGECCVVGSHLNNTLWMRWRTGENGVLVSNCGPVFDITVTDEGPRSGVVAGTGAGLSGGVSCLRSAVCVRQDLRLTGLRDVRRVCASEDIVVLSFPRYSRVFRHCTEEAATMEELPHTYFDTTEETLLVDYSSQQGAFLQVTLSGVRVVWRDRGEYVFRTNGNDIGYAHACDGLLVFSDPSILYLFCVQTLVPLTTIHPEKESSCVLVLSSNRFLVGEWGSAVVRLYELHDGLVQAKSSFQCSTTPCSLCVVPYGGVPRLVIGLFNGCVVDVRVDEAGAFSAGMETMLTMQPVMLVSLETHSAVLCLGEVPLILILSGERFQLTGIDINNVSLCAVVPRPRSPSRYLFFSKAEGALILGDVTSVQKLSTDHVSLRATTTRVKYVPRWGILILSVRRIEKDQLLATVGHELSNLSVSLDEPSAFELLENERCEFIETAVLGGANEWGSHGEAMNEGNTVLIGTSFVFPDEHVPRSSRFMWCTVEVAKSKTERTFLRLQGSKEVGGALRCCCVVPNYAGRVALGIGGCVALYSWNAADATFVAEETVQVGTMVVGLIPVMQCETSYVVASDVRHSCIFVRIDTMQGTLSVAARDPELRSVMDCTMLHCGSQHDVCLGDDMFNFFAVSHVMPPEAPSGISGAAAYSKKLQTTAQFHVGDLITAMRQGSFAPCSIVNDVVPTPMTLVRGICGPQIVYGTSHGAFGTITPITGETFLILKALEVSVTTVVPPLAGFSHSSFREVLRRGQERGLSRNVSFQVVNPRAAEVFNERRNKRVARGVCSGDVIETFLVLRAAEQQRVVQEAECHVRRWLRAAKPTLQEYIVCGLDESTSSEQGGAGQEAPSSGMDIDEINSVLSEQALPMLPLAVEAVIAFIQNIQRVH